MYEPTRAPAFPRRNPRVLTRTLGVVLCAALATGALGAAVPPSAASASPDDRLQRLLDNNPGSVRTAAATVRTPDGVEISLPTAVAGAKTTGVATGTDRAVAAAERCSTEDLCLFQKQVWEGEKLTIPADCTYRALRTYKLSDGTTWDKNVDSYINNNPKAGTWATMWWGGTGDIAEMDTWTLVESHRSAGPSDPSNAVGGLPFADIIGVARVCQP
jgi:Peptidase inhibitor family I36